MRIYFIEGGGDEENKCIQPQHMFDWDGVGGLIPFILKNLKGCSATKDDVPEKEDGPGNDDDLSSELT